MQTLSVIIPAYNEKDTIKELISRVKRVRIKGVNTEIVVVDDFSTDGTTELLRKVKGCKIFCHSKNMGKGAAIRTALQHSTGSIVIIQDADLEYSPEEYPTVLKPILDKKAEVVYGVRFTEKHKPRYKFYYFGNIMLTFFTNVIYGSRLHDMETGYKAFRAEAIKSLKLRSRGFDFEPEVTAKILKKGYKIYEVPITYKSRAVEEGKKITGFDGLKALYYLLKYRFFD